MLDFKQIKEYFDQPLARHSQKGMLVEYLQYEILDSLYKQAGSEKLSFIGGTAIRIIHNSQRFSEDLDFDNFGLNYPAFKGLMGKAMAEMRAKGFELETKYLQKGDNYHLYVKFSRLLFSFGLSGHGEEKIFVAIDAQKKKKTFKPDIILLNKFGVFRNIAVNPPSILLAQKLLAVLYRRRAKGRDFYDVSFLSGKVKPDFAYIEALTGLDKKHFTEKAVKHCKKLNFKDLAKDVEPFLFDPSQKERVLLFYESLPAIL
ncbi:nucleotidyl transferase AbiEii/AbiGii toxin family protein [Candidatus Saganbacteria bacterium]|nr:nucleotidyl transferase AbiEii/AbiGii toxin family protein [Candidatus Saganbacteria bacterium]